MDGEIELLATIEFAILFQNVYPLARTSMARIQRYSKVRFPFLLVRWSSLISQHGQRDETKLSK